jgi:hypothetical protein
VEGVIDMQNINGVMQPLVIAHTVAQITVPLKPYLVLQK